jgi:hypothetical protein
MRAVRPSSATSERDRKARAANQQRILRDLMEGADIPREATYPGMGERWNRPLEKQLAVTIPVEYVQRMTEKIVRGIFFILDGKLIEPPFQIEHFAVDEGCLRPCHRRLRQAPASVCADTHGAACGLGQGC